MAPTYVVDFEPPEKERQRLNLQHRAVIDNFGHILPPVIPEQEKLSAIADIATGTGIWLEELARDLPSTVALHGYDITDSLFPNPASLPENLKFSLFDVRDPVPEALYEKYDVVHIRGLCMVLKADEWDGVFKNISKMLKPGGYFVWTETDPISSQAVPPREYASKGAGLLGYMCKLRGGDLYITKNLPGIFTNNNYTLITPPGSPPSQKHYIDIAGKDFKPHTMRPFSQNFVRGLCSVFSFMAQNNIPNDCFTPETAADFASKFVADTEGNEGSSVVFDLCCTVGRKPE